MPPDDKKPDDKKPDDKKPDDKKPDETKAAPAAVARVGAPVTLYRLGNGLVVTRDSGVITKVRPEKGSEKVFVDVTIAHKDAALVIEGVTLLDGTPDVDAVRFGPRFELKA